MSKRILKFASYLINKTLVSLSVVTMIFGIFTGGMAIAWMRGYRFGSAEAAKVRYPVSLN